MKRTQIKAAFAALLLSSSSLFAADVVNDPSAALAGRTEFYPSASVVDPFAKKGEQEDLEAILLKELKRKLQTEGFAFGRRDDQPMDDQSALVNCHLFYQPTDGGMIANVSVEVTASMIHPKTKDRVMMVVWQQGSFRFMPEQKLIPLSDLHYLIDQLVKDLLRAGRRG